ncbi:hypothetical protein O1M63_13270 [Streptomyces mirabilis]|nr:hypothetical protein [Streptomyces mirabilis]
MTQEFSYRWGHSALTADFDLDGRTPRLVRLTVPGEPEPKNAAEAAGAALPLVDVTLLGQGTGWSGPRFTGTALGQRLTHRAHHAAYGDGWHHLTVQLQDRRGGLTVFVEYSSPDAVPVLRARVRIRNDGDAPVTLRSVSSLLLGALPSPNVLDVHRARNDWLAECRWHAEELRESVPDVGRAFHGHDGRAGCGSPGAELAHRRASGDGRAHRPHRRALLALADRVRRELAVGGGRGGPPRTSP